MIYGILSVWVFDILPQYHDCEDSPEDCEAQGATLKHQFDHSVNAPKSIIVTCKSEERVDGLPDWTWYAEDLIGDTVTFHRPIPSCFDPTFCYDDPPMPGLGNAAYDIPSKGTLKYLDGESVRYTCDNAIYRFPQEGIAKEDWLSTLDVKCGWANQWDPPNVYGCVDPRGCEAPPERTNRVWGSYEDTYGPTEVGDMYWYECREGQFEFTNGTTTQYIDLTCKNDDTGGAPYWVPPYDHDGNPFPKCVKLGKYDVKIRVRIEESIEQGMSLIVVMSFLQKERFVLGQLLLSWSSNQNNLIMQNRRGHLITLQSFRQYTQKRHGDNNSEFNFTFTFYCSFKCIFH